MQIGFSLQGKGIKTISTCVSGEILIITRQIANMEELLMNLLLFIGRESLVHARSEHHPLVYQSSLHTALSDSKAATSASVQSDTVDHSTKTSRHTPLPISATPSTQTFDNTIVELPAAVTSSLANQRHLLPVSVTSSSTSTNQRQRSEMLEYFTVRRPQLKWKRPVRLPPTNSERCLKTFLVYQSRSHLNQRVSSTDAVSRGVT